MTGGETLNNNALGFIELKSIPVGVEATDEMLKSGNVELVMSSAICPGKYMTMISGDVGAVRASVATGEKVGGSFVIDAFIIPNIHDAVMPALLGVQELPELDAIGMIETIDGISSILAADAAVKASKINLLEVRIARGLGGKAFITMTGDISAVNTAIDAAIKALEDTGMITSHIAIANPHKDTKNALV